MDSKSDDQDKTRLGRILIDRQRISKDQLDAAMREQGRSGHRLGDILAGMKVITQAQVQGAIRRQRLLRLAAGLAAAVLGPMQAHAAGVTGTAAASIEARPFGDDAAPAWSGVALDQVVAGAPSAVLHPDPAGPSMPGAGLRMQALDDTNALARFQHAVATAQAMQQGARGALPAGVRAAGELAGPSGMLALNVSVSQVTNRPGTVDVTAGTQGMGLPDMQAGAGGIGVRGLRAGGQANTDAGRIGGKAR